MIAVLAAAATRPVTGWYCAKCTLGPLEETMRKVEPACPLNPQTAAQSASLNPVVSKEQLERLAFCRPRSAQVQLARGNVSLLGHEEAAAAEHRAPAGVVAGVPALPQNSSALPDEHRLRSNCL